MIKRLISTLLAVFFMPFCGAAIAASCTELGNDDCVATVGCVWVDDACKSSCEVLYPYGDVTFYMDMNACQIPDYERDSNDQWNSFCETKDYLSDGVSCEGFAPNVQEFESTNNRLTFRYTTTDDKFTVLWTDHYGVEQTATSDETGSMYIFKPHEDKTKSVGISNYKIRYRFQGAEREAVFCEDVESSQYYQNLGDDDKDVIDKVFPDACIMPGFTLDDNDNGETIFDGLVCDLALSALKEEAICNGSLLGEDGCGWWDIRDISGKAKQVGLYAEATWQPTSGGLDCNISDAKFIMSANMPANTDFSFTINAPGEYVVDWGDGTVNRYLIKPDDSSWQISHTYTTAKIYEIKMSGQQTGARLSTAGGTSPVINFSGNTYIYEMMGDLSSIFNITSPYMFSGTFANCTSLQSIPSTLFSGVTAQPFIFQNTFYGCTELQSIPSGLFSGVTGEARYMFQYTFYGCTELQSIPSDLFSGVTGAAAGMFNATFYDCKSLQSIPVDLFENVKGEPGAYAFRHLFSGATNITKFVDANGNTVSTYVPTDFFGGLTKPANYSDNMFQYAFANTKLAEVCPDGTIDANPYYATAIAPRVVCKFNPEFTIKTINMAANTTFSFDINAKGTYTIDWGDGNVEKIVKIDTTAPGTITHTYANGGVYTIGMAGSATDYNATNAAISFNGNTNIAELGGSLGAIFGGTAQPYMFANTFSQCTNLTTIPETLFSGVSGSADRMFNGTFQGCTSLTEIPDGLFSDVTGAAYGMFFSTFAGCTLLTSIPVDLFKNVTGEPGLHAFANLFNGAENITNFVDANGNVVSTYVPTDFFDGLTEPANYSDNMFKDAFAGTKLAQTCDGIFNVNPYYATAISPKVVCAVLPKITYDFSGGTGENKDGYPVFFVAGETVVPENTSVKSGYKFSYWTCYADGSLCNNPSQNPGDVMDLGLSASELKAVESIELRANWETCPAGYMCPADSAPIECPANSTSTDGATSCTCNSGFTLTGTAVGAITTTGDACRLVPEFTITTIKDMADKTFSFTISAAGLYTIDWGDGNVQKIGKDTTATTYTHTYESAGVYTIGIAGDATAYNATNAAISFRNNTYVAELGGRLGAIFGGTAQPYMFLSTFQNCTNLTTIPSDLFSGVSGAADRMFNGTFGGCTSLTEIPDGLFSGVDGAANGMFYSTFSGCTSLTSIPVGLFANVKDEPGTNAFANLFNGAENITNFVDADRNEVSTYVPTQFFGGMSGTNASAFTSAFEGTGLAEVCPDGYVNANPYYATAIEPKVVCIPEPEFTITTIEDMADKTFSFTISAAGIYTIDWGDGSSQKIKRTDTNVTTYTHTYAAAKTGGYTIGMAGSTMTYNATNAAISFRNNIYVAELGGSLGAIFDDPAQPYMFQYTFQNCTNLTAIPETLFSGITGAAASMFYDTFAGCTSLQSIPSGLFSGVSGAADKMFSNTFGGCTLLQSIPDGLFSGVSGAAGAMFYDTFKGCTSLQSIPDTLFSGVTVAAHMMFFNTFANCTSLQSIPVGLFANVKDEPGTNAFANLFNGAENITNFVDATGNEVFTYVPTQFFGEMSVANVDMLSNLFQNAFVNTQLVKVCPNNTYSLLDVQYVGAAVCQLCPQNGQSISGENLSLSSCFILTECSDATGQRNGRNYYNTESESYDTLVCDEYISCNTGYYFDDNTNKCTDCPAGSYCSNDVEKTCPPEANKSDLGAGSIDDCYAECSVHCTETPCIDNAECEYVNATTPGKKYYEQECNAVPVDCEMTIVCNTGYYFDDNTGKCTVCPAGSYCSNGVKYTCPPEANKSDLGARSVDDCYAECSVHCTQKLCIENATCEYVNATTPGKQYYEQKCNAVPVDCAMTIVCNTGYYLDDNTGKCETAAYWVKYLDEDDSEVSRFGASYGDMYTFSDDPISKQGYTQNGWLVVYPESMSGKKYEMGEIVRYDFTEDITLKPEYSANTFELVFQYDNADNAGSVSLPQDIVATYDQPLPEFTQYDEIELRLTEELGNSGWDLKVSDGWKLNEKFKAYNKNGTSTNDCPLWSESCDLPDENNTIVNVYPVWTTADLKCAPGYYGYNKQCAPCRAGNACPGWNTWVSADQEYGMFQCPENSFSEGENLDYCTCAQGYSVNADYNGSTKLVPTAQDGFKNVSCQKKQVPMYYDLNGGYGNIETDYWEYGTVATPVTAREFNADEKAYLPGYTFGGWGEKPSARTPVPEYANYTEPKTLYAIWMPCGHGTYMTAAQAQDLQTECTACPLEYPSTLDTASENIEQCYADCEAQKDVEGGVAFRDQEYVLYGNQCTYSRGQDENGNGCDIINDVCWATDCKPEFEMIDGKCVACARDFALDYSRNGNCQVERCVWGFHPNGDKCEQDEIDCDAPNAVSAKRIWDSSLKSYGACVITQCVPEMHVEANTCVSNVRTCALENGFGEQVWNDKRNVWKDCVATHCNPGYTNDARLTNENWKQCGRCNNMFGLDGKLAVSSYVSECEIATCMYQGEKYVLENNECRLICDDYRDETGRRYWDEERAECVHDCGNGYLPW